MNESDLKILELSPNDLIDLSDEQKEDKIKSQFRSMSRRFHPDKNRDDPQATEHFQKINTAYRALCRSNTECHSEIHTFSNHQEIIIPDTAFSLLLEENIEAAFDNLNYQFRMLRSEQEKKEFRDYYGSFLNLAFSLEKKRPSLQAKRAKYFYEHMSAPFYSRLTYEWRNLIIRLFAEEYLDDFKYRHALATGNFTDILATRKLLSPIKVIVALLNTINLFLPISYRVALAIDLFFFHPSLVKLWISYISISGFLEFLASPVNNIIRPIAEYSGISPFILTAAFLAIGATGIYSSLFLKILFYAANDWPMLIGSLIFFFIYEAYKIWYNMRNITQNLPLPIEPVPEHIQEATNLVSKKATLSHQLFNTPKDTEFLLQEERTFSQQTASFFGAVIHKTTPYKYFPIPQMC